jgi:hypothetical protein
MYYQRLDKSKDQWYQQANITIPLIIAALVSSALCALLFLIIALVKKRKERLGRNAE